MGGLGFETDGRMVSGGGTVVKIWEQATASGAADDGYGNVTNGGSDDDSIEDGVEADQADEDEDDRSDEEETQRKPKKRKRTRGKATNVGNGIMGFKGMD